MLCSRSEFPDENVPKLKVNGVGVEWRESVLYLGINYDRKLTWSIQFDYMVKSCESRLSGLRKICRKDFGLTPRNALIVYKAFIRPVLEYGCISWLNISDTKMRKLQIIQNKALRLALRAPIETPIIDLHREAIICPLKEHLLLRAAKFLQMALERNTLSGRDARFWLALHTEEEIKNTPLGVLKHLI